jgi:hypothetical protein
MITCIKRIMSILADHQYTLLDFENIKNENTINELDNAVIQIINEIAQRVGAPGYQKTPVFKKKDRRTFKKKYENKVDPGFKKTELNTNVIGIEAEIDKIRTLLNKITKKNYTEMSNKIINAISFIVKFESEDIEKTLSKIGTFIFEIGSSNKFLSNIYAKLYKELIDNFNFMKHICQQNFEAYSKLFDDIQIVNDSSDYDLFCECNKVNEKRRSMSCFLANLINNGVIDNNLMIGMLFNLKDKINNNKNNVEKKLEIEEIIENLYTILVNAHDELAKSPKWSDIYDFIEEMSECNSKDFSGLSNKVIFKCVDIIEEIDD